MEAQADAIDAQLDVTRQRYKSLVRCPSLCFCRGCSRRLLCGCVDCLWCCADLCWFLSVVVLLLALGTYLVFYGFHWPWTHLAPSAAGAAGAAQAFVQTMQKRV